MRISQALRIDGLRRDGVARNYTGSPPQLRRSVPRRARHSKRSAHRAAMARDRRAAAGSVAARRLGRRQ